MHQDFSLGALWTELYADGTVTGGAILLLILIAIAFAAQAEAIFSACRNLTAHRTQMMNAQQKMESEVFAARETMKTIDQSLPDLRETIAALTEEYQKLDAKAVEARRLRIREIVMSDIFVQPGDLPYIAKIYRPAAGADEPLAAQWRTGRDHVLYGPDKKAAVTRFAQRYSTDHGFVVGPASIFDIPWNPPEEQPTLDQA